MDTNLISIDFFDDLFFDAVFSLDQNSIEKGLGFHAF